MPENQNIEWKSKWRDDYLEWICGFANAQGGRIYIGRDDNGHIIGLDNTRKLLEDIPNKVRNAMSIVVDVNRLEEDGKEYIEIVVPPYPVAISCFSEQAANYSVVGNCILVNVQICNKEKKISNFPLYASLHLIHEGFS